MERSFVCGILAVRGPDTAVIGEHCLRAIRQHLRRLPEPHRTLSASLRLLALLAYAPAAPFPWLVRRTWLACLRRLPGPGQIVVFYERIGTAAEVEFRMARLSGAL